MSDERLTSHAFVETLRRHPLGDKSGACPAAERLADVAGGLADAATRRELIEHLGHCPACAEDYRIALELRDWARKAAPGAPVRRLRPWVAWLSPPVGGTWPRRRAGVPRWALGAAASLLLVAGVTLALRLWRSPDDSVIPPRPATVFALKDGNGRVVLDAEGRVEGLPALPAVERRRIESVLLARRLEPSPVLKDLRDTGGALMGAIGGEQFRVVAPVSTAVESDRPTFRWQPLNGARGYQVLVSDPVRGYREVEASPETSATTWSPSRPLARGRTYVWQVVARTRTGEVKAPAPDEPEARFNVLEQDRADALAQARERYTGRHLVLGLLYYEAGVVDRAREHLEALVADNPASTEARSLLASVQETQPQ